jgi:hypothetical protein
MSHLLSRRATRALATGALCAALLPFAPSLGCGGADESLGLIGGEKVDSTLIDRDPIALLPSGIILLGYIDAYSMFQSKWGADVAQVVVNLLPLGPESNFSAQRDVTRIYSGLYAMQGADFCAVVQGNFDPDAIRRAADARAITISGAALVKTRYADNDLYTAGNIGFVVLTSHTVITGNETAMRRVLDRLRFGKLERSVAPWMVDLLLTKNASMALAGELASQPTVAAASQRLPFLGGLRIARILGNFQAPGMNFAGSLTYADAESAKSAAVSLQHAQQIAGLMSLFTAVGFGAAIPSPDVKQQGNDLAFTLKVDEAFVRLLLRQAADISRASVTSTRVAPGGKP